MEKSQPAVPGVSRSVFGLDDIPLRRRERCGSAPGETVSEYPAVRFETIEDTEQVVVDKILVRFVDTVEVDAIASQPLEAVIERSQDGVAFKNTSLRDSLGPNACQGPHTQPSF